MLNILFVLFNILSIKNDIKTFNISFWLKCQGGKYEPLMLYKCRVIVSDAGPTLWPNIKPILGEHLVFVGMTWL